ncbi:hypothetical protein K432DRAFT_387008 [Lepidopterella palustris CBS 459.81]|uniref:Ryanodine receptor Ryr domain-containing protein n=1 Tax=Lepidopterella palustris CBS 459.81 TaxID=1314670 RepID=A0A8E2J9B8_9PEZI|nr:hypothetical protein K432DRAFT_387008 [Lepidopterella palustris CBS 459.81]
MGRKKIVIAGAVTNDWLTFPQPNGHDLDSEPWRDRDTSIVVRRGGVGLLTALLSCEPSDHRHEVFGVRSEQLENRKSAEFVHSILDMVPVDNEQDEPSVFKVERLRRIRNQTSYWHWPQVRLQKIEDPALLLVVDSSNGFKEIAAGLDVIRHVRPGYLLYKTARPLGTGLLWDEVRQGPWNEEGVRDLDRLVVVVNADDLRAEGIELSRHLSWEKAAEDFVRQIGANGRLDSLITCANLIVRFGCDGVIHHRGLDGTPPKLYFDPMRAEGEFIKSHLGYMIGLTTAFTAGLATGLVDGKKGCIEMGIRLGFAAARRLAKTGFRINPADGAPDYPLEDIVRDLEPDPRLASVEIPSAEITTGLSWSILEDTMGDPAEIARHIVQIGPSAALGRVPTAHFGRLMTADRQEIESFRSIINLLNEYLAGPQTRPLCIGVFGPHGSGKAFAAVQVAESAAEGRAVGKLEYNVSQFATLDDLASAFQQIRDHTLSGSLPLVFFDTFDAAFRINLGWLRHFLVPMQSGRFSQRGQTHALGPAVFFFISSSFPTFTRFAEPIDFPNGHAERAAFYAAKGPDFISCLRGYVDVLGPDCADPRTDRMYPIRRALLLRALLERRAPSLRVGERLTIDDAVLNGLLMVPNYRHGARSLEMVLAMSTISGKKEFERAALPSEAQLNLHVDGKAFMDLVRYPRLPAALRETIAKNLNSIYRLQRRKLARTEEDRQTLDRDPLMAEWDDLDEEIRESTRNQADDIPHKLRMVNCYMSREVKGRLPVNAFTESELDVLAEREHERWNAERLQKQWRSPPREGKDRLKPYLIPWRDLEQQWKDVDRATVECVPRILPRVGYHIYRLGTGGG